MKFLWLLAFLMGSNMFAAGTNDQTPGAHVKNSQKSSGTSGSVTKQTGSCKTPQCSGEVSFVIIEKYGLSGFADSRVRGVILDESHILTLAEGLSLEKDQRMSVIVSKSSAGDASVTIPVSMNNIHFQPGCSEAKFAILKLPVPLDKKDIPWKVLPKFGNIKKRESVDVISRMSTNNVKTCEAEILSPCEAKKALERQMDLGVIGLGPNKHFYRAKTLADGKEEKALFIKNKPQYCFSCFKLGGSIVQMDELGKPVLLGLVYSVGELTVALKAKYAEAWIKTVMAQKPS